MQKLAAMTALNAADRASQGKSSNEVNERKALDLQHQNTKQTQVAAFQDTVSSMTGDKFANGANSAAYAQMAGLVYNAKEFDIYNQGRIDVDGFLLDKIYEDDTGIKAALFVRGNEYVLSFAGTTLTSWPDWVANVVQGAGKSSAQYEAARALAVSLSVEYGQIHFVGHSLGGGLAAMAAFQTGSTASIYNPAGLHYSTINGSYDDIQHYYSDLDVLRQVNFMTLHRGVIIVGQPNSLGNAGWHSMSDICKVYDRQC